MVAASQIPSVPACPPNPYRRQRPPAAIPQGINVDFSKLWKEHPELVTREERAKLAAWQERHDMLLGWRRKIRSSGVLPDAAEMAKAFKILRPLSDYVLRTSESHKAAWQSRCSEAIVACAMEHIHVSLRILRKQLALLENELELANGLHATRCAQFGARFGISVEDLTDPLGAILRRAAFDFAERLRSLEEQCGHGEILGDSPRSLHSDLMAAGLLGLPAVVV